MSDFASSYLGRLRAVVGSRLLLVPSTHVVIEDDRGRILMELRSDFGAWGLPGGVPDEREDIVACAERETLEETGLQVTNLVAFGFASKPDVGVLIYPNGHACHYFAMLLTSCDFSGTLASDGGENSRLDWFEPDALPKVISTAAPTIEAFCRWKATGTFQMI